MPRFKLPWSSRQETVKGGGQERAEYETNLALAQEVIDGLAVAETMLPDVDLVPASTAAFVALMTAIAWFGFAGLVAGHLKVLPALAVTFGATLLLGGPVALDRVAVIGFLLAVAGWVALGLLPYLLPPESGGRPPLMSAVTPVWQGNRSIHDELASRASRSPGRYSGRSGRAGRGSPTLSPRRGMRYDGPVDP